MLFYSLNLTYFNEFNEPVVNLATQVTYILLLDIRMQIVEPVTKKCRYIKRKETETIVAASMPADIYLPSGEPLV